jgi:ABC-type glycerol-3-phosphate transport system permease component
MRSNRKWLLLLLGLAITFVIDFPILTVALNSFRTTENILSSRNVLPSQPTLANYAFVSTRTHFWTFLINSAIVASLSTVLGIVLAALAGFALSRFRTRILSGYNQTLLLVQMFPLILAIIPLFIFFRRLDLVNNFTPVVLVYTVTQLPFATWMLRSYFDSIPRDLDEAAIVDGASPLRAFVQIILPLSIPGIVAVCDFLVPLLLYRILYLQRVPARREPDDDAGGAYNPLCSSTGRIGAAL